jgi:hypothetical protein
MRVPLIKFYLTISPLLLCLSLPATEALEILDSNRDQMNTVVRQTAMPELDDTRLGKILERYYSQGLGGSENWSKIESVRSFGTLRLKDNLHELAAYQKKPSFMKMVIRGVNGRGELTLGYNGARAWKLYPKLKGKGVEMEAAEARLFIHTAGFGNHLLYPYQAGKSVAYVDTVPLEGNICHQVRVTLETDFQVDYFIDIRTFLELKVVSLDLQTQATNTIIYRDHIRVSGIPISRTVISYDDGEWSSELTIKEVKVNSGVMPWMFEMPN